MMAISFHHRVRCSRTSSEADVGIESVMVGTYITPARSTVGGDALVG